MKVTKISGNDITVKRGQDNTKAAEHVLGAPIFSIIAADAEFIEVCDDFGFDGNVI